MLLMKSQSLGRTNVFGPTLWLYRVHIEVKRDQCVVIEYMSISQWDPSKVTTVLLLLPECQRSRPPCVAPSLSLTAPEDGKWCQSIHQSNTGGCAEESWGRGNGSVQEERGAWLWLPAATISPYCCSWCCSALMDWLTVHPSVHSYKRFLRSVLSGPQWQSVVLWECLKGLLSRHPCMLHSLCHVLDHLGTQSPRLVRLKECDALIKDV